MESAGDVSVAARQFSLPSGRWTLSERVIPAEGYVTVYHVDPVLLEQGAAWQAAITIGHAKHEME